MQLNNNNYLFHYTTLNNLEKILENGLRFNSICKQADYHEGKYKFGNVTRGYWHDPKKDETEQLKENFSIPFEQLQIISLIQNGIPKIEIEEDDYDNTLSNHFDDLSDCQKNHTRNIKDIIDDINEQFIFESKGYYNNYMWERYGDKHNGICLILDKKKLFDEILKKYGYFAKHNKVEYKSNEISEHNNATNNENIHLFQKDLTYSHENEYRILLRKQLDEKNRDYIGKNAIEGVIVGIQLENEIKMYNNSIISGNSKIEKYNNLKNKINFYCLQRDNPRGTLDQDVFPI